MLLTAAGKRNSRHVGIVVVAVIMIQHVVAAIGWRRCCRGTTALGLNIIVATAANIDLAMVVVVGAMRLC